MIPLLAGATLLGDGGGGGPSTPPFTYDTDTYWWDFTYAQNTTDALGDDTYSYIPERIGGVANAKQTVKDYQPFIEPSEGLSFGNNTNRHLVIENTDGITNDTNGWYIAFNFKATTATGYILVINSATTSSNSRARIQMNASRQIAFRGNTTDSATLNIVAQGEALSLDTWYTVEILWDLDADDAQIFINGVEQTLTSGPSGGPWSNFPASDPSNIIIGNGTVSAVDSADGTLQEIVFYNGVPSAGIQTSISEYMQSRRYDRPDAPVISAATGNTTIAVSVTEPDDHNSAITDYEYQYKLNTEPTTWTNFSDGTSATPGTTITGVTNDLKYNVRARAINGIGTSDWSNSFTVTPTANPGPPNAPVITGISASTQITIPTFSEPGTNGYDITDYRYYYRVNGVGSYVQFSDGTSSTPGAAITGLTNGTAYQVYATAVNSQGESDPSNVIIVTPTAQPNLRTVENTAVADFDFARLECYGGTGTLLTNLVASPFDGEAASTYNIQRGDGATSGRYPAFSGTAGDPSTAKFVFDSDDYMTLVGSNTSFINAWQKTTGGRAHWFIIFGKFVVSANTQYFYSTRQNSTAIGVSAYVNSSEVFRFEQCGDTTTLTATPATVLATGAKGFVAFSVPANGGTVRHWNSTTTKVSTTRSFNATTSDAGQKLHIGANTDLSGELENLTEVYAIAFGEGYLDDAQIAAIVAEYESRHGADYTP